MTQDAVSPNDQAPSKSSRWAAWSWIPTLYFSSGFPYIAVSYLAAVMYKNLGVSNADLALYTSDLLWPWVLKPFWSPLVDVLGTQRRWTVAMQALIAVGMLGVAYFAPAANFLIGTLACFWLLAIASATHDIAADGFYMASMSERDQAWFIGIRSSFYRLSMIIGSGLIVGVAGWLAVPYFDVPWIGSLLESLASTLGLPIPIALAWSYLFGAIALFFAVISVYHTFVLPRPLVEKPEENRTVSSIFAEFVETFVSFFQKPGIGMALAYLLIYRFSEAQLTKMKAPFLLDPLEEGGLGLTNGQLGLLDGTIGIALLTLGGIVGGIIVARDGLRRWIFPMALAINLPNAAYAYLAWAQPENLWSVGTVVGIEQFCYGFGFAGYLLYMLQLSRGKHQTAHYALCTGFMALGMMIPSRYSGIIQEWVGYEKFFLWVIVATIPSLVITLLAPLREESASAEEES